MMRPLTILGVVLILIGVGAALFGHFSYTETTPVLNAGPLHVDAQHDHTVWIPTVAAIVTILAGTVLVFAGRRRIP